MKKINLNDEVNAKILQILDEHENDIAAANKALEELYNEQQQIHELENERKMLNGPHPPTFVTIDEFIEICKNT